jgi:1-aminocyclopropane-1-carboxylate deaminase
VEPSHRGSTIGQCATRDAGRTTGAAAVTSPVQRWAGDFYGIPVESTIEAIKLSGSLEGMIIDPVYEGKSMAGLIDLVRSGEIPSDSTVLYAHLGGQPALNAYAGIFD